MKRLNNIKANLIDHCVNYYVSLYKIVGCSLLTGEWVDLTDYSNSQLADWLGYE